MTSEQYITFPDSIGQPEPAENPPVETEIQALLRKLRSGEITFSILSQEQKEFIKSISTKCPGCGNLFPLYDARQGKIKKTCSRKCAAVVRIINKWDCVLCRDRFKNPYSLQKHIEVVHKEYTLHQYLVVYYKSKGEEPGSRLAKYCEHCARERKLNFAKARYDNCWCQNLVRKIETLENSMSTVTDEIGKRRILKQIAGCRSVLSRRTGQKKPNTAKIQSTSLQLSPIAPPPPPVKSLVTIEPGYDFNAMANFMEGVLSFATPVFNAYYNLVETRQTSNPSPVLLKLANTSLHQLLQQQQWTTELPSRYGYWAFVSAFAPDNSDFSPNHLVKYYKELTCDRTRLDEFYSKVKFSDEQVGQFLMAQKGKLMHPVPQHETNQAFYRIMETSIHFDPRLQFNPHFLWQLDQLYGKQ